MSQCLLLLLDYKCIQIQFDYNGTKRNVNVYTDRNQFYLLTNALTLMLLRNETVMNEIQWPWTKMNKCATRARGWRKFERNKSNSVSKNFYERNNAKQKMNVNSSVD